MSAMAVKEYGYEYDATLNEPLWARTEGRVTDQPLWGALCLRSGRDALKIVAREYAPTTVLLPALACDSMVLPFTMYGHRVIYYRLREDYRIDLENLYSLIPTGKALLLYMDYFGVQAISDSELEALKEHFPELVLVEDRTHDLIWEKPRSFVPDYTMASLRKWLQVPDGGLLWTKRPLVQDLLGEDISFSATRLKAQCMRNAFFHTGDVSVKAAYRKIFSTVSDIMDGDKMPSKMSAYAYGIAAAADWDAIRTQRQKNAAVLIEILKKAGVRLIQEETGRSDLYVPLRISNRDKTQELLSSKGIFNTVIWPLSPEQKAACDTARRTVEEMLAAPCDQRYTEADMEYIGNEIVRAIHG